MIKVGVFASGEGTNFQAILDACRSGWIPAQVGLLVSSDRGAGALHRAEKAGVETVVVERESFKTPKAFSEAMAATCKKHEIDWVCLAGFMHKLAASFLKAFPDRVLNIHPALLPAFGGKGMYGKHVHEAVLAHGAKITGCTVHFVDEEYDHGPIVLQSPVAVLDGDTPLTLAKRVQEAEHWAYPCAVRLAVQGRLYLEGRKARILAEKNGGHRVRRALISVSDKTDVVSFATGLKALGVEIVSTSGTAKTLKEAGIAVRPLSSMTAFPEILGGRVKTLHPKIHGGILYRRQDKSQSDEARAYGLEPIDVVVVNLYPFAETARKAKHPYEPEVIEQIDIGGPAMIRAAAKNYEDVAVVTSPHDYHALLEELKGSGGQLSHNTRMRLAGAAFRHTADYDNVIARTLNGETQQPPPLPPPVNGRGNPVLPEVLEIRAVKAQAMRYGENPHQAAALYRFEGEPPAFEQLQGKPLSYNNLLDAESAWELVGEFGEPAAVICKHNTPCGAGTGRDVFEAWGKAWAGDPLSAFGGILAVNRPVTAAIAKDMTARFMEVVIAPEFEPAALELYKSKQNLRLLRRTTPPSRRLSLRSIGGELLVQEPDRQLLLKDALKVVGKRKPTAAEMRAMEFAWTLAKHVRSNAIVLAGEDRSIGIGSGQMSRIDSVRWAGIKAADWLKENPRPEALVLASDAFFPFRDGIDEAARLGVTAVIQPGGSVRDEEVIKAADEHGLALVFTAIRHFRH